MRVCSPEWFWSLTRRLHARGFRRLARLAKASNFLLYRTLLPAEAIVGDDLRLDHYALGVVVHPNVTIGNCCRIYHHVTIAGECVIGAAERVTIGDRVTIGVHAVIMPRSNTSLRIGNDAIVGAGAVVTGNVPPRAVVAGVPARVIRYREVSE